MLYSRVSSLSFRLIFMVMLTTLLSSCKTISTCYEKTGLSARLSSKDIADGCLTDTLVEDYSNTSITNIYACGNRGKAERNIELNKLLTLSDHNYQEFRNKFYADNATTQLMFDWVSLGLSTAGALTTGGAAPILSGASAAVQGAQGKLNSRFFLEKTTETLVNSMDTLRAKKKELIVQKMANLDIAEYSTEEGVCDVLDYHYAGSLISALVEMSAESGKEKQDAVKALKTTEGRLAAIRSSTKLVDDDSSQTITKFLSNGDKKDNKRKFRDWMKNNGLSGTSAEDFLNKSKFAEQRRKAVKDLKLSK